MKQGTKYLLVFLAISNCFSNILAFKEWWEDSDVK